MKQHLTSLVLAGSAPDTGNHGVSALARSTVIGLAPRGRFQFTLLDNGDGVRTDPTFAAPIPISRAGFRPGRNILRRGSRHQTEISFRLGLRHPTLQVFRAADAVLDVSGGDSFSDIYGPARFEQMLAAKRLALRLGKPLVMLPQTIGPFENEAARVQAVDIMRRANLVYARDHWSFEEMKRHLGRHFDPARHKEGVDLAFGLSARVGRSDSVYGAVGLNVSGLLWASPADAAARFGLSCSYRQVMTELARAIIALGYRVVLVPHVVQQNGRECDLLAARALWGSLNVRERAGVQVYEGPYCASALKGLISQMTWFAGARMHATIAALSSATPVANMAYSDKAAGVFACMGAEACVVDMRALGDAVVVGRLMRAFHARRDQRDRLEQARPGVEMRWAEQMDAIAASVSPRVGAVQRAAEVAA